MEQTKKPGVCKKIICIVLTVLMLLTTMPLSVISFASTPKYKNGDIFQLGSYPVLRVTDTDTVNTLIEDNFTSYISVGTTPVYRVLQNHFTAYSDGKTLEYTTNNYPYFNFYGDMNLYGDKYRGVFFFQNYKVDDIRDNAIASASIPNQQYDNGYTAASDKDDKDSIYWFEYQPLYWQIVDAKKGLAICTNIITAMPYARLCLSETATINSYSNSFVYSNLTSDFLDFFTSAEQFMLKNAALIDEETSEKIDIFSLPTVEEITSGYYADSNDGAANRAKKGTDYAKVRGLLHSETDTNTYMLQDAKADSNTGIYIVNPDGTVTDDGEAYNAYYGLCPAMHVDIDKLVTASTVYSSVVNYGTYPQSRVTDKELLAELNDEWMIRECFALDTYYADIEYKGEKYRAVYNDATDIIKWYLFEPVQWDVVDATKGYLLCRDVLEYQAYNKTASTSQKSLREDGYDLGDWRYSDIRAFLSDEFYNVAFTTEEQGKLKDNTLSNQERAPYQTLPKKYKTYNTTDKVFLPDSGWHSTYADFTYDESNKKGANKVRAVSDYAIDRYGDNTYGPQSYSEVKYLYRDVVPASATGTNVVVKIYTSNKSSTADSTQNATYLAPIVPAITLDLSDTLIADESHVHCYYGTKTAPTCGKGYTTYTCRECGKTFIDKSSIVPGTGEHTEVIDIAVEPTLTTSGYTQGCHCSVCEEVLVKQTRIPARSGNCGKNATWTLIDGVLSITGTGDMYDFYNHGTPWAYYEDTVTSVNIADGITGIGVYNFGNTKISSIDIPASVTKVGKKAFYNCPNLLSATFYGNAPTMGDAVFDEHKTSYLDANGRTVQFEVLVEEPNGKTGWPFPDTTWYNYPIRGVYAHDKMTLELNDSDEDKNGVKYSYGAGVATIIGYSGSAATVTIPAKVSKNSTEYLVTQIGEGVFKNNMTVTTFIMPYSIEVIGKDAFNGSVLEHISLREYVTTIGSYAFANCTALSDYSAMNTYTVIPEGCFMNDTGITNLPPMKKITQIGSRAFYGCVNLNFASLNANLVSIGAEAFYGCTTLYDITIEGNVTTVGDRAFYGCSALKYVTFTGAEPSSFGTQVFDACNNGLNDGTGLIIGYNSKIESWYDSIDATTWIGKGYFIIPMEKVKLLKEGKVNSFLATYVYDDYGVPAEGICVNYNDKYYDITDRAGMIFFITDSTTNSVSFSITQAEADWAKKNKPLKECRNSLYRNYGNVYCNSTNKMTATIMITRRPTAFTKMVCNDTDITTTAVNYNLLYSGNPYYYSFKLEGFAFSGIKYYELIVNDTSLGTSKDGSFCIYQSRFSANCVVYAKIYAEDGTTYTEPLKINFAAFTCQIDLSALFGKAADVPTPNKLSKYTKKDTIDFDIPGMNKMRTTRSYDNEYMYYISTNKQTEDISNETILEQLQNCFENPGKAIKEALLEAGKDALSELIGVSIDMDFWIGIYGKQNYFTRVTDVGGFLGMSLNIGFSKTVTVVIPLHFELDIGFTAEAKLEFSNDPNNYPIFLGFDIDVGFFGSAGIGGDILSAGIYGKLGAGLDLGLFLPVTTNKQKKLDLKITYNGEMGLYAKFKLFTLQKEARYKLFGFKGTLLDKTYLYDSPLIQTEQVYLPLSAQWNADVSEDMRKVADGKLLEYDVDANIEPQVVQCDGKTMMFYVGEISDGTTAYQQLVYSIYDEAKDTWSAPVAVMAGDETIASDFTVVSDNSRYIYISTSKLTRQISDKEMELPAQEYTEAELTELAKEYTEKQIETLKEEKEQVYADALMALLDKIGSYSEAAVTRYDITTGKFDTLTTLTENNTYENMQTISLVDGIPTVVWVQNTANDVLLQEGQNDIYYSQYKNGKWNDAAELLGGCGYITDLTVGELNNKTYVAFVSDSDGDLNTTEDRNIFVSELNGKTTKITKTGNKYNSLVFAEVDSTQQLFFTCGTAIQCVSHVGGEMSVVGKANINNSFKILTHGDEAVILYSGNNKATYDNKNNLLEGGTDICGIFYHDGWGGCVELTDSFPEDYLNAFGAAFVNDNLIIPYLRTVVTFTEDDYAVNADLCSYLYALDYALGVNEIYYDKYQLFGATEAEVRVVIANKSSNNVEYAKVTITDPDSAVVYDSVVNVDIPSGKKLKKGFTIALPETVNPNNYTVTVTPTDATGKALTDNDLSDNTFAFSLGYSDIQLQTELTVIGETSFVTATLANYGTKNGVYTLNVYNGTTDELEYAYPNNISIAAGNAALFKIKVTSDYFESDTATNGIMRIEVNEVDGTDSTKGGVYLWRDLGNVPLPAVEMQKQPAVTDLYYNFDKYTDDILAITTVPNGNSFTGVSFNSETLIADTDYTVNDSVITFTDAGLSKLSMGENALTVLFENCNPITIAVNLKNSAPVEISGTVQLVGETQVGSTLTFDTSAITPEDAEYTVKWMRDGVEFDNGDATTYVVEASDVDKIISAELVPGDGYTAEGLTDSSSKAFCNHNYKYWYPTVQSTCTKTGNEKGTCMYCGATSDREKATQTHISSDWIVDVKPGAVTEGSQYKKCIKCNTELARESIEPTGVNDEDMASYDAYKTFILSELDKLGVDEADVIKNAKAAVTARDFTGSELAENKTALDTVLSTAKTDLTNARKAAFASYKTTVAGKLDELGEDENDVIKNAKTAVNDKAYDDAKSLADNKAVLDSILASAKTSLENARKTVFEAYKTTVIGKLNDLGTDEADVIKNAKSAAGAASYDTTKTLAENKAILDAMVSTAEVNLDTAKKAAFASYKTTVINSLDAMGFSEDEIVINAKTEINGKVYNEAKSLAENKAVLDAVLTKAEADLGEKIVSAFTAYKTVVTGELDKLGADEADVIKNAKTAVSAAVYDTTKTLAENKAALDDIVATAKKDLENAREVTFEAYKTVITTELDKLGIDEADVIANAKTAVNNMEYDSEKSVIENKSGLDVIIANTKTNLEVARKSAFDTYKAAVIAALDDLSEEENESIEEAKAMVEAMEYDNTKTLAENNGKMETVLTECQKVLNPQASITFATRAFFSIAFVSGTGYNEDNTAVFLADTKLASDKGQYAYVTYTTSERSVYRFKVEKLENCPFEHYKVEVNNVRIYADSDGIYTVEVADGETTVNIFATAASDEGDNLSFWEKFANAARNFFLFILSVIKWKWLQYTGFFVG